MNDLYEIIEGSGGWSVYRNNRILKYDAYDEEEALREVKRRAGRGVTVTIYDINDEKTKRKT